MLSLNPKYIIQVQKPYLCNITCLNMVLYRQHNIIYDQEELASFFNVKIHPRLVNCFTKTFATTANINDDEGLKTIEEEENINKFFKKNNISLVAKAYKLTQILELGTLKDFIESHLKKNNDMWIEYKLEGIWEGYKGIHDGLIESLNKNDIVMINPGYDTPNRYSFDLDIIEESLSRKFARETGIIVIKRTNH